MNKIAYIIKSFFPKKCSTKIHFNLKPILVANLLLIQAESISG